MYVRVVGSIGEPGVITLRVSELVILLDVDGSTVVSFAVHLSAIVVIVFVIVEGNGNNLLNGMITIAVSFDGSLVDDYNCSRR